MKETGRSIDDDHYGTGFFYYFGSRDDSVCQREIARFSKLAPDSKLDHLLAVGADELLEQISRYVDQGIPKFILRPLGNSDTEVIRQTRELIEKVLPKAEKMHA